MVGHFGSWKSPGSFLSVSRESPGSLLGVNLQNLGSVFGCESPGSLLGVSKEFPGSQLAIYWECIWMLLWVSWVSPGSPLAIYWKLLASWVPSWYFDKYSSLQIGGEDSFTAYCEPFGKAMQPTTSNNHKNTCSTTTIRPDSIASAVDSDLEAMLIGKTVGIYYTI